MKPLLTFWRKSLSTQLLASMLLALFVSQSIGLGITWDKFRTDLYTTVRTELGSRAEAVARLIETVPAGLEDDIALVNSTDYTRFWISQVPANSLEPWLEEAFQRFEMPLSTLLNGSTSDNAAPARSTPVPEGAASNLFLTGATWTSAPDSARDVAATLDYADRSGAGLIVPLSDGRALNVAYYKRMPSIWATHLPFALALTAILVSLVGLLTVRRITRPLGRLTKAAETLGRGEAVTPLRESGPDDIRRTAEAFNLMQERLHRFVTDRTRMLGAIGHDLRTPLTTLRLRAELVEDADLQERMLDTIDEMQAMTEATLSLARQEATLEETRTIDLSALVESVCDDLAELGQPVRFLSGDRINYRCRPDGLRRTIRNLVENAVRYAGGADVQIVSSNATVEILVEDNGPGIPIDKVEDVFAPFFRLEGSRSRETGGVGLGLSISRAIVRQHGGDIILSPREPGLRAAVVLPA
jgi:signal transduction histidine kinase